MVFKSVFTVCLDYLTIVESGILKPPTITVLPFISSFSAAKFLLYIFWFSNVEHINIYHCYVLLICKLLYRYIMIFLVCFYRFYFKAYFVALIIIMLASFFLSIRLNCLFPFLHSHSVL